MPSVNAYIHEPTSAFPAAMVDFKIIIKHHTPLYTTGGRRQKRVSHNPMMIHSTKSVRTRTEPRAVRALTHNFSKQRTQQQQQQQQQHQQQQQQACTFAHR
jgi:hypothetical protein